MSSGRQSHELRQIEVDPQLKGVHLLLPCGVTAAATAHQPPRVLLLLLLLLGCGARCCWQLQRLYGQVWGTHHLQGQPEGNLTLLIELHTSKQSQQQKTVMFVSVLGQLHSKQHHRQQQEQWHCYITCFSKHTIPGVNSAKFVHM
jgi:hypothetical protein